MTLLDRLKVGAEQVAARALEEIREAQARRALTSGYEQLGVKAFELAQRGELEHAELSLLLERVRGLHADLVAREGRQASASGDEELRTEAGDTPDSA